MAEKKIDPRKTNVSVPWRTFRLVGPRKELAPGRFETEQQAKERLIREWEAEEARRAELHRIRHGGGAPQPASESKKGGLPDMGTMKKAEILAWAEEKGIEVDASKHRATLIKELREQYGAYQDAG